MVYNGWVRCESIESWQYCRCNMKFVILVLALVSAVIGANFSEEQKERIRQYHKECSEETGVDQEKVNKVRKGDWSNDDDDLQKYIHCMMMKAEVMDAEGNFNKEVAMTKLPPDADKEKVSKAMDTCSKEKGATPQETAYKMVKCYHFENPDHAII